MLKYWLGIVGLFVWGGCSTSFTPQEVKVIKEGGGIMRVWKTDNREDSLFLRQQAIELTPGEIRTELFQVLKQFFCFPFFQFNIKVCTQIIFLYFF